MKLKCARRHIIRLFLSVIAGCFFIDAYSITPTADCSTNAATQLTVGTSCNTTAFDVNYAIGLPALNACNGYLGAGEDGWGWFTATGTTTTIEYTHSNRDAQIFVYSGTCGSLSEVACADNYGAPLIFNVTETVIMATVPGQVYFIRIVRVAGTSGQMNGTLCVYSNPPAANDNCANAIAIACGATVTGTTVGSLPDAIPAACYASNFAPGVWYSFVGTGVNTTLSLCGSGYDTQIAVLTGTCGAFTCATYNDEFCGSQSQVTILATTGTTYYVYVFGYVDDYGSFTLSMTCAAPPPAPCLDLEPNGCPDIDLGLDISIPTCTIPCVPINIPAQYFETGSTTTYTACSIPYAPYPYNTGTGFSIGTDDYWTNLITLPFNFCFYGNNYSQCVVGPNGLISFNTAYALAWCEWQFTATCPNAALPRNAIFGAYHDLYPPFMCGAVPCGDARYATFGVAPCRVFVVSYDNVPHYSCTALRTSCEIVLYETTNVIEVFIESKPTCTSWNFGNALIGIQNAAGTTGISPVGRNTGPWTAANEGWRFIPNGPSNVQIAWFDQNGQIGTGSSVSICPSNPTETFVAEATYTRCDGSTVVVTDDIIVQCAAFFLPVEWQSFDVKADVDQSIVSCLWSTATEKENDFFTVQRSVDAETWIDVGNVDGSGTSFSLKNYSFQDKNPAYGVNYYRIMQTDFNGKNEYSEIRSVDIEFQGEVFAYPNPSNEQLRVMPWKKSYVACVRDMYGREITCEWPEPGKLNTSGLPTGAYLIELSNVVSGDIVRLPVMITH